MDLFHNNYLTQTGTGPTWNLHINPCERKTVRTYYEEISTAAQIVYENSNKKLKLLFSGGIDSEYMINVFRTLKIPFDVVIVTYNIRTNNWNGHDTAFAFEYCRNNNIDPIVVDVDVEGMLKYGKAYDIAMQTQCCSIMVPVLMHAIEQLDGDVIMAQGEPYFKNHGNGLWLWEELQRENAYVKWFAQKGINGAPEFLKYTAESMLAFMLEPRVIDLVNDRVSGKMGTRTSKPMIYGGGYTYTPRKKYHGFEIIKETPAILELENVIKITNDMYSKHNGMYSLPYYDLLKKLVT